ncbi:hypothetical protein LUZ60_010036 [Juncus effusus]|nr:hypothetical protein LUZ60_010036 [Juncus effusus]
MAPESPSSPYPSNSTCWPRCRPALPVENLTKPEEFVGSKETLLVKGRTLRYVQKLKAVDSSSGPAQPPEVVVSPPPPNSTPPPIGKPPPPPVSNPPPPDASPPPGALLSPPPPSNPSPFDSPPTNPSPSNPSPSTPSQSSSPPSGSSGIRISTSIAVGVAVGGLFVLLFLSLCLIFCCKKKKRSLDEGAPPIHYDGPSEYQSEPYKDDPYRGQYKHWKQQSVPPSDQKLKFSSDPHPHPSNPPVFNSGGSGSNSSNGGDPPIDHHGPTKGTFTYQELLHATNGFADSNLLGQGGFGYVHKGVLPNGKEIAVKQLKSGSGQGEKEFQAEVDIIGRVHHKHLVSLVGYCMSDEKRLLVYEFVPNSTLEFHLLGKGRPTMEWPTRMKIALGAAKGLAYLHQDCHPKIIHRDIKASNILLDDKFEAKVADFGLAKFTSDNNTHISTRVMGTFGYLAPEYASSGKLTDKSDVFSFGVMLLVLITGRRPVDTSQADMDDSLVDWARPLLLQALEEGTYEPLVDKRLGNNLNEDEVARMIACAAACVRHSAKRRPRMSQVVRALEGDTSLEDLNEGVKPGQSRFFSAYISSDDSGQYNEDMKKFKKMAEQSNEYQSSQFSAPSSEYALYPSGSGSEGSQTREMEMRKMKNKDSYQFANEGY